MRLSTIKNIPVLIGITTGAAIIGSQILSTLVIYNFFRFDAYLALVAISFLAIGYTVATSGSAKGGPSDGAPSQTEVLKLPLKNLSSRELSILQMIALGNTNKEIATNLGIELSTVKTHINNIYVKIGAANRKEGREKWNEWKRCGLIS